jgi:metal-sulfur cluster biosynthetic enzyme
VTGAPARLTIDEGAVRKALAEVIDPCSVRNRTPLNLVEMGLVDHIECQDKGRVRILLLLTDPTCVFFFDMATEIKARVSQLAGVCDVEVAIVSDRWWEADRLSAGARARLPLMRAARDGTS